MQEATFLILAITLNRSKWVWLGPLRAPMRRLIVSAEDQSGLVGLTGEVPLDDSSFVQAALRVSGGLSGLTGLPCG
jgi:hypothetical protein